MDIFPVDSLIPGLLAALDSGSAAIIQSPPGSGKSTRIPPALLAASWLDGQKVLMLEPRRIAAVNLASFIASQLGEGVGERVGYAIRFDRKVSERTRLEIVTEGLLTRRMQSDPYLDGVGAVIFDEFHERSIHSDTSLALCIELQRTVRPELRIVVMSATLDLAKMQSVMPDAALFQAEGRLHPVEIRHCGGFASDPVPAAVAAVAKAVKEHDGDILVFLPGAREIRRTAERLAATTLPGNPLVMPLYGEIPLAAQQQALRPAAGRKVVLSTNIAETSLTIEGVTVVVDSGLVRRSRFDRSRGLDSLVTGRISKASAAQRAGRAGRLAPGVCYRLWSEAEQQNLLPFDPPEIMTSDLGELALNLALWGITEAGSLAWVDQPPAAALSEAKRLLALLGALDAAGRITADGRRMAALPLNPRLARLLLCSVKDGCAPLGADIAALLSERDILRGRREASVTSSDLLDRLEILSSWRMAPDQVRLSGDADLSVLKAVDRLAAQLLRLARGGRSRSAADERQVSLLAATGFPDRIAMQREPGSRRYLLANGQGAELDSRSGLFDAPFLVAVNIDGGDGGNARIFAASRLELEDIKGEFAAVIARSRSAAWEPALRRVAVREAEQLGAITLQSRTAKGAADEIAAAALLAAAAGDGTILLRESQGEQLQARLHFVSAIFPDDGWPDVSDAALLATAADWLPQLIAGMKRPEQFSGADLAEVIGSLLDWQKQRRLDQLAPTHLVVPSGSRIAIDYAAGETPVAAVKLQELFGEVTTPTVAAGRVKLLIHLLSPAGRPIQVTSDLAGFWKNGYPEVKKELKGRYPKHPWPDDPLTAMPTRFTKKRSGMA